MKKRVLVLMLVFLLIAVNLYAAGDLIVEGNAGIGTTTPTAKLDVNGSMKINGGIWSDGTTGSTPTSGAGTRLMWIPAKHAFRAGTVTGIQWDDANIGVGSFAVGKDAKASGPSSIVLGGDPSSGWPSIASAWGSVAMAGSQVFGNFSVGIGIGNSVSGQTGIAIGRELGIPISGENSINLGYKGATSGYGSIKIGSHVPDHPDGPGSFSSSGTGSIVIGTVDTYAYMDATGDYSLAIGRNLTASANSAMIIGENFTNSTANSLEIGFGQRDFSVRSGVITAYGNVGVGVTAPNTKVDIDGDVALRAGAFTATNGNNNNINIGGRSFIRITVPTTAFTVTGIAGGVDGKVVILYNATVQNMTIANESTSSTDINRITTLTGSGVVTTGVGAITLIYDSTASRWIVISVRL